MSWRDLGGTCGNDRYRSPAPVLTGAVVHDLQGNPCGPWDVLIDTGADMTIIPQTVPPFLGIWVTSSPPPSLPRRNMRLTGAADENSPVVHFLEEFTIHHVQLSHPDFGIIGPIETACMERESILLGRDCLKWLLLKYDGKNGRFHISRRRWRLLWPFKNRRFRFA